VTIQDIRAGLETNLQTISGLRASSDIPDNPNPPEAVIGLETVEFDNAYQQGLTIYRFRVTVLVSRASDRWAQRRLDAYSSNGDSSIKLAIESDKTLNGAAFDTRVVEMGSIGTVSLGEATYLAADFAVEVLAD